LKVGRPQEIGDDRLGAEAGTGAGVALAICHHDDLSLEARIAANPNPTDISPGALNRINTESTTNEICPPWLIWTREKSTNVLFWTREKSTNV